VREHHDCGVESISRSAEAEDWESGRSTVRVLDLCGRELTETVYTLWKWRDDFAFLSTLVSFASESGACSRVVRAV
jgi:hypothetical protein